MYHLNKLFTSYIPVKMCFIICLFFYIPNISQADKLILKNGSIFKGKVTYQDKLIIKIKTEFATITLQKSKVKHIFFEKPKNRQGSINVFTIDNKIYRGLFIFQDENILLIRIGDKKIRIPKNSINRVDWRKNLPLNQPDNTNLRLRSLWRSALLPGWGQFYQKRTAWGFMYSNLIAGSIIANLLIYNKYQTLRTEYLSYVHNDARLALADSWRKKSNTMLVLSGIFWLWQALDAGIFPPSIRNKKTIISLAPDFSINGWTITIRKKF